MSEEKKVSVNDIADFVATVPSELLATVIRQAMIASHLRKELPTDLSSPEYARFQGLVSQAVRCLRSI